MFYHCNFYWIHKGLSVIFLIVCCGSLSRSIECYENIESRLPVCQFLICIYWFYSILSMMVNQVYTPPPKLSSVIKKVQIRFASVACIWIGKDEEYEKTEKCNDLKSEIYACVFPYSSSYQNACYRCENAENRTWSEFFMTDESFGGSV